MLEAEDLEFGYGSGPSVLHIPRLKIERGERVYLFGPSGSGKTTFLSLVAGVQKARQGRLRVLGHELSQMSSSLRDRFRGSHVGYIFQMFNLIPYLSVRENILLPVRLNLERAKRLRSGLSADSAARELAAGLGIEALFDANVTELSVGQQQRVAAARALIGAPELIIADEPTSALDTDHRERFLKILFEQAERMSSSLLFVSHDPALKPLFQRALSLPELNARRDTP